MTILSEQGTHKKKLDEKSIRKMLKAQGLRYSKPRALILQFLAQPCHASAETLYQALTAQGHTLSLSTVYLNLNVLSAAGMIKEFTGLTGETLYDGNVELHHHLICETTGESIDVPLITIDGMPITEIIKKHVEEVTGWQLQTPEIVLRGFSGGEDVDD